MEGLWSVELGRLYGVRVCLCGLRTGFFWGGGGFGSLRGGMWGRIGEALEGEVFGHRHT